MSPLVGPSSSSFRGMIGVARQDITPPRGIHARNWAAATHETAEGVHRPLTLTALTIEREFVDLPSPHVLISADLMSWRSRAAEAAVIGQLLEHAAIPRQRMMFCLTHTHAAPSVRAEDANRPGGALIEPYQQALVLAGACAIRDAQVAKVPATITWRYGRCDLAMNRDLPEPGGSRIVCGFNPATPADDTLLVGRVTSEAGVIIATIVNYACHPTTLGWENRLTSPDFVGAMREIVESHTAGAPCLFLQGASGELAPAEQYVADTAVADRHGRRLGHAVLSTLEAMDQPGVRLTYDRVNESGAPLAVWRQKPEPPSNVLSSSMQEVELPLKPMPPAEEIEAQRQACDDPIMTERLSRKLAVRKIVGEGDTTRMPLFTWRIGQAMFVAQPNEAYSRFQSELRARFPDRAVAVMNLVNGSAGYLPPRELYEHDIYQVAQSPYAAGGLEKLIETAGESIEELIQ